MLYNPFLFYLNEWFSERKGLAYGIFWAGTGIFGSIVPLLMEWSLGRYGPQTTLRVWAAFVVCYLCLSIAQLELRSSSLTFMKLNQSITLALLIQLLKPRLPVPEKGVTLSLNLGFLRSSLFWFFQLGNIIQGLGNFIPGIYLPS